jgi:hypothetical protein
MHDQNIEIINLLSHSTVRIECETRSGDVSTGTGFFFNFFNRGTKYYPAIVTNKHVIKDSKMGHLRFTRSKNGEGSPDVGNIYHHSIDHFESRWISHPDPEIDLCMLPIATVLEEAKLSGAPIFTANLNWDVIPNDADIADLIGMEKIVMVGYPNGLWDRKHNLPIFRSGVAATDYAYDWNGRPEFLIDCACFPGSSGSPVLLCDLGPIFTRKGLGTGRRTRLLGILYGGHIHDVTGKIQMVPVPTGNQLVATSAIPMNLGVVIKAKKLKELRDLAILLTGEQKNEKHE